MNDPKPATGSNRSRSPALIALWLGLGSIPLAFIVIALGLLITVFAVASNRVVFERVLILGG